MNWERIAVELERIECETGANWLQASKTEEGRASRQVVGGKVGGAPVEEGWVMLGTR